MRKSTTKTKSMRVCLVFVCFLLFLAKLSNAQDLVESNLETQSPAPINWLSFEQLSDSLQYNPGKKILISFHATWCAYCRKMKNEVYTKPEIVALINREYFAVSFDAEFEGSVHFDGQEFVNQQYSTRRKGFHDLALLLASKNGQVTLPATLILDKEFNVLSRHFEYLSPKKLLRLLN